MIGISISMMICVFSAMSDYPADARLLIIHADDVGMCHSVNVATAEALEEGMVTCGSVMVPCPWFLEVAEYCREHPEMDLGIHVTLTSEWKHYRWRPVSSIDKVPGLIDEEGYLWHDVEDVVTHATPEEVKIEIKAQVQRAIDFGMKPTHIDTHMGTVYAKPEFFKAYIEVAREFDIPPMVISPDSETVRERMGSNPMIKPILDILKNILGDTIMLDELVTGVGATEFEQRKEQYKEVIQNLKPGVTQLIIHLGLDSTEMHGITSSWLARYNDLRVFTDPEMREFINEQGVKLVGWKDEVE